MKSYTGIVHHNHHVHSRKLCRVVNLKNVKNRGRKRTMLSGMLIDVVLQSCDFPVGLMTYKASHCLCIVERLGIGVFGDSFEDAARRCIGSGSFGRSLFLLCRPGSGSSLGTFAFGADLERCFRHRFLLIWCEPGSDCIWRSLMDDSFFGFSGCRGLFRFRTLVF